MFGPIDHNSNMSQPDKFSQKPLRVIVIGAGIVGLSLSHALQLANIDHVVLEKNDKIMSVHGAALMIYPAVARILDQFGILKNIHDTITPVQSEYLRWPDGSINIHGTNISLLQKEFDMPVILFHRQKCVEHLYDGLPDQSKIRTSARIEHIEHTATGIKVCLTDGTFEEGDLVVGADGVHSLVRQFMWDYAAENEADTIPKPDKEAFSVQYKGIFGIGDQGSLPGLGPADVHVVLGEGTTRLLFTQNGLALWALTYKDEYSQPPKRFQPDKKEQDEIARRFKDLKITENITFGHLYKNKTHSGILNIEEGILEKWHAGRIVLVGDSAHKMTVDLGMGANMGIESAVSLANALHRAVTQQSSNDPLTTAALSSLFEQYQSERYPRAKQFVHLSSGITRMRSYETWWKKIVISRISTLPFVDRAQGKDFIALLAKGPKLEYAKTRTINDNAAGWKVMEEEGTGKAAWVVYGIVTSVVAVGVTYLAATKWGVRS